ncbi:MAG: helix-hairpin-helix domain-containing protein [Gemmatimonadota bacterium]|nr:helix-hairpin-helix domain-containing protein [Gemmatimonadota bacterium]
MQDRLKTFVERHPEGWNHDEWLGLLSELEREEQNVPEPAAVGRELEMMRLERELDRRAVRGIGPKRRAALVDRFGSFGGLRTASVDDVAQVPSITRALAEKVIRAVH